MHVQRYTILVWELHPCSRIEEIDVNRCQWRLDKLGQTIRCQRQLFLDSLAIGEVTRREITVPQALICEKVFIRTLPFYLEPQKILTLTSEDSWPTSTGLLWLSCLLFQDSPTTFRSTTPEIFSSLISIEPLVGAVCGDRNSGISFFFEFCNFFHWQRAEMVRTRSRVTSPGPQESRDASSNPHRDR